MASLWQRGGAGVSSHCHWPLDGTPGWLPDGAMGHGLASAQAPQLKLYASRPHPQHPKHPGASLGVEGGRGLGVRTHAPPYVASRFLLEIPQVLISLVRRQRVHGPT